MSGGRAVQVRRAAAELGERFGVTIEASHESGARWLWQWRDGPSKDTMRTALAGVDLAGADVEFWRAVSARALAVATVRVALAEGEVVASGRSMGTHLEAWRIEQLLDGVDDPAPATEREALLVERLLAAATPDGAAYPDDRQVVGLVEKRGLAWLLAADLAAEPVRGEPAPPLIDAAEPMDLLTAAYAQMGDGLAWRTRAAWMPRREAVAAALADPDAPKPIVLAALAVLRGLRAEQEATERAAFEAARRVKASYSEIGSALGMSKQSAHELVQSRLAGVRSRAPRRASA